ncbi:MAG TPA: 6-bladed beta-propeller [Edaphocola sp.]|nr:6-bladed beta-propeller [Edaphocola sp.]
MKFRRNTGILLLCLGIIACNNKQKHEVIPTFHIKPNLKEIPCSASKILSNIKVVHLETTSNCLIGPFSALIFVDNKHIIFRSEKRIIVFDNQGNYLNKIDAVGKGPGEYNTIVNAYFDPVEEYIYIVDYNDIKIYNIDGNFIKSLTLSFSSSGIYRKSHGEMVIIYKQLYNKENRDMLSLLDSSFNIYHTFKSKNPDVCKDVQQNLFFAGTPYEINGRLFYVEPFVETIYEIIDTILVPHWSIKMGDIGFKTKDGINTSNYQKASDKIPPISLHETEKYFFIDYMYNYAKYMSLYDKKGNKFIFHQKYTKEDFPNETVPVFGLNNDIIKNTPLFWPQYTNGNIIASVINLASLSDNQLKEFNCNVEDNPILFIGILK